MGSSSLTYTNYLIVFKRNSIRTEQNPCLSIMLTQLRDRQKLRDILPRGKWTKVTERMDHGPKQLLAPMLTHGPTLIVTWANEIRFTINHSLPPCISLSLQLHRSHIYLWLFAALCLLIHWRRGNCKDMCNLGMFAVLEWAVAQGVFWHRSLTVITAHGKRRTKPGTQGYVTQLRVIRGCTRNSRVSSCNQNVSVANGYKDSLLG